MQEMVRLVDKSGHIPVDEWDTPEHPIDEQDRIFRNIRGEIILPIHELFGNEENEEAQQLDYFAMNSKRSYNSDETREHICRYLNYFEKYYDYDKELLMVLYEIKINIDYIHNYSIQNFMDDVNRYIIRNTNLTRKVRHFVDDNYLMKLSNNNNKTPNLQFNNSHAKVLYEISLLTNMYIPLATHYMYIHFIKDSADIQDFMLSLFDMCMVKYEEERGIDIYNKLYETATSVVNKSKNPDKVLWEKNQIRGNNATTHTKESVIDIILQILPKYAFKSNIINFNYFSNRQCLRFKITDIAYELSFQKLSSSKRDSDQNSEYDRFEARLTKKDEALALQNKVAAEQTVRRIEDLYGPFSEEEILHYKKKLTLDGAPIINNFQKQLVGYLYYKDLGDPITLNSIRNQTDYIKLIIAAKRMLLKAGMVILPYIISSRVVRTATRKIIGKKDMMRYENAPLYEQLKEKYNNERVLQKVWELIGTVTSSTFEIIDWDENAHQPSQYDGINVPIINDIINEELLFFITSI